jgi:malonyl-CoA O-methyltransferase
MASTKAITHHSASVRKVRSVNLNRSKPAASGQQGEFSLDRRALRRGFARAAENGQSSSLHWERLNGELLERLQYFALQPRYVLDLGAGACHASLKLREHYRDAQVVALDFAIAMLQSAPRSWWPRARFHRIAADAVRLPFTDHSFDLVYSNLLLPFCDRPERVFREVARVLKDGGVFVFSSLGPQTLKELRAAWADVDDAPHVSLFLNLPQLGDALMQSGLVEPVMDTEQHPLHYCDVRALMRALKLIGAANSDSRRARSLTGRGALQRMIAAYEAARTPEGIPATFEVIFGAAFAGAAGLDGAARGSGEVAIPVSSLRKHVR